MDEAPYARLARCVDETARAAAHDPLELLCLSLPDRDEVHDAVDPVDGPPQALGVGHVTLGELAARGLELRRLAHVADENADLSAGVAQRTDDVAADEARSAGHEDQHVSSVRTNGVGRQSDTRRSRRPGCGKVSD